MTEKQNPTEVDVWIQKLNTYTYLIIEREQVINCKFIKVYVVKLMTLNFWKDYCLLQIKPVKSVWRQVRAKNLKRIVQSCIFTKLKNVQGQG